MSPSSRWYPVLKRYIALVAARVDGLGGNSAGVKPSLQGVPVKGKVHDEILIVYSGKVSALIYDRFGDFEGFILDTEDGERQFASREPQIEAVVNRAWVERIVMAISVEIDTPHCPKLIELRYP